MARAKPCLGNHNGCRALTTDPTGRCDQCRSQRNIERGSSTARGYDQQHRHQREWWKPLVATGNVRCRRCDWPITPDDTWDLGHTTDRNPQHSKPEHSRCNRATATKQP